ncbi:TMV resistance protein N-like [Lotus japonicus]|uniref:TMV resistance protein N-like n=1 Tax=Lotus japonicus TaxID=34305 RepID=UPI002584057F|nr:TMV resistance protein N-like [Lotus japonicus]
MSSARAWRRQGNVWARRRSDDGLEGKGQNQDILRVLEEESGMRRGEKKGSIFGDHLQFLWMSVAEQEGDDVVPYSTGKWAYDVFLSFRGVDTRKWFTSDLYHSLKTRGIRTFFDDDELSGGKEIKPSLLRAIEESMIGIVVFSPNYASSSYCLDELVHIMDCCKGHDRLVLPVFVDVDPAHVRHQLGSYGEAMAKHEQQHRVDHAKLEQWRQALADAANLSGWAIQQGSKSEYMFVRKIIGVVSRKINRTPLHNIAGPNFLVGLDDQMYKINTLLELEPDQKTIMVGIWGHGGVGKTTFAQAVYSWISDQFEGICFLADVTQKSRDLGLVRLQEKLLSDILDDKNIKFTDASQIIPILKRRLHRMKVLLILDDVSSTEQLESLAGDGDWFGSGSKVIITTRDRRLLDSQGVHSSLRLDALNFNQALHLFCLKAFEDSDADPDYMKLSKRIVNYSLGIPLTLELVGSNLFGKSISEWKSLLDNCERYAPDDIPGLLIFCFQNLDDDVKTIFLDIACCFNGYKLDHLADLLLSGRGFSPKYALQVLISKSFIKVDDDGEVRMHDLVQEMGRRIVYAESPADPGNISRLWAYEDILHVLRNNTLSTNLDVDTISTSLDAN